MSFQIYDERAVSWCNGVPGRVCAYDVRRDFGDLGILPLIYAAAVGGVAVGGLVASWLSKDDWSYGEYNAYMNEMYQTILLWDKIGWSKGCWNDANRRARWSIFMNAFGKFYGEHGKISAASFVSDAEEKPARDFMRKLSAWSDELNASCNANIPNNLPNPNPNPAPPPSPTDPLDYLKYGVWLVGGILALQLVSSVRGATAR